MARLRSALVSSALLLLAALPLALGHGGEASAMAGGMDMGGGEQNHHSMVVTDMDYSADLPSYWSHAEHAQTALAHIVVMVVAWVVILPVAVMLSVARSRLTVPAQALFHLANGVGLFVGFVYNHQTPDLYKGSSHHTAGWIITGIAVAWTLIGIVNLYAGKAWRHHGRHPSIQPVSRRAMAEYQRLNGTRNPDGYRWSSDSGQGTDRNTESLCDSSRTSSRNSETNHFPARQTYVEDERDDVDDEKQGLLGSAKVDAFLSRHVPRISSQRTVKALSYTYVVLERFILLLGFFLICSGVVVYGGIFRANNIFNGMAHFVKGGIFFWYGLFTLGRWMGCFAEFGWAWNLKPDANMVGRRKARVPSAEFTESFLIWFYGASNVFLEHLGDWGGEWTPMDLEHVSITIMFFGGGLLGMLIESSTVRKLVKGTMFPLNEDDQGLPSEWKTPKAYVHSLNPIPALVILLLGIMMSSHTQHSLVSGQIHKQWGNLFVGAALARGLTYLLFWLKPPTSYLPARPPSELITSFCLVSGGAIFMASNSGTVHALEVYQLDAMFVFTVTMGLTALVMAWVVVVIAIKGWAARRG